MKKIRTIICIAVALPMFCIVIWSLSPSIIMGICLMVLMIAVLFLGAEWADEPYTLKDLKKWQILTMRGIFVYNSTDNLTSVHALVEMHPGKLVHIKFNYSDVVNPQNMKIGYHYQYDGKALVPLPIGKNS
ncbi:MAG: hypothetical protein P4L61_00290 [Candidatus Pacebacteria bacterium]|nr:hypothetical protein [Candidatus Paceibacterota bacterium]